MSIHCCRLAPQVLCHRTHSPTAVVSPPRQASAIEPVILTGMVEPLSSYRMRAIYTMALIAMFVRLAAHAPRRGQLAVVHILSWNR